MAVDANGKPLGVDMQEILLSNLGAVITQGVIDNQRMSQYMQNAFLKDLMQGGQGASGQILAALNSSDRTPIIKVAPVAVTPAK